MWTPSRARPKRASGWPPAYGPGALPSTENAVAAPTSPQRAAPRPAPDPHPFLPLQRVGGTPLSPRSPSEARAGLRGRIAAAETGANVHRTVCVESCREGSPATFFFYYLF